MQISDEMVERAARAAYAVSVKAIEPALGIPMCKFEDLPERDLNLHQDYARAALTAALAGYAVVPREPTPEMLQAGDEANPTQWNDNTDVGFISDVSKDIYRAMIDTAPPVSDTPVSGWRDIASAPKDGERILLGFSGSMSAEGYWHDGSSNHWGRDGWYFADDDVLTGRPCDPDCWQPLPIPPASRGE